MSPPLNLPRLDCHAHIRIAWTTPSAAERAAGATGLQAPHAEAVAQYGTWMQPPGVPASGWIVVVAEPDRCHDRYWTGRGDS